MQPILFFDGVCNLCHGSVRFVVDHERDATLGFAPLQSELARTTLVPHGIDPMQEKSVVLVDEDGVHLRSEAAWRLARHLKQPWRSGALIRFLPLGLRDRVYDLVAAHRYRWFGKRESCELPDSALRARFLDTAGDSGDRAGTP